MKFINSVIPRVVFICVLFSSPATLFGQETKGMMKEEIQLDGEHLKLVDLALAEFRKNNLDSLGYKLFVYRIENGYVALFEAPNIAPSQRGSSSAMLSFEVEIDNNHELVRSNFVR